VNETDLVTNVSDPNLINAWGIVIHDKYIWVNANNSDKLIRYDLNGANSYDILFYDESGTLLSSTDLINVGPVVNPTGIVVNPYGGYFVTDGTNTRSSTFLIASESGDLFGYNKNVGGGNKAYRIYYGSTGEGAPVYKGLAVTDKFLYAADFLNGNLDLFTDVHALNSITLSAHKSYPLVGPNYASPFNVVFIDCILYVLFAYKTNSTDRDDNGTGGFIDIYDIYGVFVKSFSTDVNLKSPWGMVKAPACFKCGHETLLVGNFGSGTINAYKKSGLATGNVYSTSTTVLVIDGLWGLYTYKDKLYFAAGPQGESNGLVGYLRDKNSCCDDYCYDPCYDPCYVPPCCDPCNPCRKSCDGPYYLHDRCQSKCNSCIPKCKCRC